jgi:hypothetical protein
MPSRVVTKRRVKRRQQRLVSKNVKRKARTVRTLRKHRKSVKKVMRGGDLHSVIADKHADYEDDDRGSVIDLFRSTPTFLNASSYVIFKNFTVEEVITEKEINYQKMIGHIKLIIFRVSNEGNWYGSNEEDLEDIYLIFFEDTTQENIIKIVKILLKIDTKTTFTLDNNIPESYDSVNNFIFVKLTQCKMKMFSSKKTYCIKFGVYPKDKKDTDLNKAKISTHKITSTHAFTNENIMINLNSGNALKEIINNGVFGEQQQQQQQQQQLEQDYKYTSGIPTEVIKVIPSVILEIVTEFTYNTYHRKKMPRLLQFLPIKWH